MNLAEVLQASGARDGDRPAVTDTRSGRTLRYGELAWEAEAVAAFLAARGVERAQRIGLLAPNAAAYLPAAFGLLGAGACLVPIASNLTAAEIAQITRGVELNGCLSWPGAEPLPGATRAGALTGGECDGFALDWIDRRAPGPAGLRAMNPAFIRFTSGTTASSKGVVLSHEATLARVRAADRVLGYDERDRILWVLPLAYHFAVTIVAYVQAGAHILLCADALPQAMLDAARRLEATVLYAAPLHFERMGAAGAPLPGVRLALSTSAPIAPTVMERFAATCGVPVGQAYGLIEAGLPCINTGREGLPVSSVGRAVPGYEVAAFSDAGERLPVDELGEIGVRGPGLFSAYYAPWRRREEVSRDGWFLTGDMGRLDRDGALFLRGRKKAIIFVAGLKFFPEEVEDRINEFPGVRESRVFGRPHPHLGEVPCAEVVVEGAALDVEALKRHCARALSPYKVPLDFSVVGAVPRSAGGKILRRSPA